MTALSVATAPPPNRANSAAPTSGANSFIPSWALDRQPLTCPSAAIGMAAGSSADSPASSSTFASPHPDMTAKTSHVWPPPRTRSRVARTAASPRLTPIINGRRGNRSTIAPSQGAASVGAYTHSPARPASALEPVKSRIQTPATSAIAVLPKPDTSEIAMKRAALRRIGPPRD